MILVGPRSDDDDFETLPAKKVKGVKRKSEDAGQPKVKKSKKGASDDVVSLGSDSEGKLTPEKGKRQKPPKAVRIPEQALSRKSASTGPPKYVPPAKVSFVARGKRWNTAKGVKSRPHELNLDTMWAMKNSGAIKATAPRIRPYPFLLRNFRHAESTPVLEVIDEPEENTQGKKSGPKKRAPKKAAETTKNEAGEADEQAEPEPDTESPVSSEYEMEEEDEDEDEDEETPEGEGRTKRKVTKRPNAGKRAITSRAPLKLKVVKQISEETASIMRHSFIHKGFPTNKAIILLAFANIPEGTTQGLSVRQMGMYAQAQKALSDKYGILSKWRRVIGQTLPSYPKDFRLINGLWVWLTQRDFQEGSLSEHMEHQALQREYQNAVPAPAPALAPAAASDPAPAGLSKATSRRKANTTPRRASAPGTSRRRQEESASTGERYQEDPQEQTELTELAGTALSTSPLTLASPPSKAINSPFTFKPFKQPPGNRVVSED